MPARNVLRAMFQLKYVFALGEIEKRSYKAEIFEQSAQVLISLFNMFQPFRFLPPSNTTL